LLKTSAALWQKNRFLNIFIKTKLRMMSLLFGDLLQGIVSREGLSTETISV
jgi:hypothetical protein